MKIVILFHQNSRRNRERHFDVGHFADIWVRDGHEVVFLYGTRQFIPADVCIMHVDMTVVPTEYVDFAFRYPVVVNGKITDTRKSRYSKNLLTREDDYQERVIIKSNQNYAGWPEFILENNLLTQAIVRLGTHMGLKLSRFYSGSDYKVFESLNQVPEFYFNDDYYVVEKFLPEYRDNLYYVNMYLFFGDCHECYRLGSARPIVKGKSIVSRETIEPHPEILAIRTQFDIDFGKLDYCIHNGKVELLDINKIIGFGGFVNGEIPSFDNRARALYDLVDKQQSQFQHHSNKHDTR